MSKATFNPTIFNKSGNKPFAAILDKRISRRDVLVKGGSGMAAVSLMSTFGLTGCGGDSGSDGSEFVSELNFNPIPGSLTDAVVVPEGYTAALVVLKGSVLVHDSEAVSEAEVGLLDRTGNTLRIESAVDAKALLLMGEVIEEPIVGRGPFVMNTTQEIRQAIEDYQDGKMGHLS